MKTLRFYPSLLAAAAMTLVCHVTVRADETTNTIKFSDPSKPGTLKISLGRGELRVQGADTAEVSVKSEAKAANSKPRRDGLREISTAASYSLKEDDNIVTLDAAAHDMGRGSGNFKISVPRNTTVVVQNAWGGDITCANISGDIEINSMHGEIRLDDVAGGVVVGTHNGEIRASIRELHEGKSLSFTSMNGEVQLRVPESAKANVRLKTQNGSVLTDFEESALVTKTEAMVGVPRGRTVFNYKNDKVLTVEIQNSIREAVQLGLTGAKEALEAVKEGIEAARLETDDARRQVEDAKRDIEKARRDSERDRRDAERRVATRRSSDTPAPGAPPAAPAPAAKPMPSMSPKISIPTITGGKLVTGALNGGGPEISVSTMNGDVIIRKLGTGK